MRYGRQKWLSGIIRDEVAAIAWEGRGYQRRRFLGRQVGRDAAVTHR